VYQVALDRPGNERVSVLWNGDGSALRARVRKNGTSATLVDRNGNVRQLQDNQGWWVVDLPAATAHFKLNDSVKDPDGYFYIGGDPVYLVEEGVDTSAPVQPPALGDPGSVARDFRVFVDPDGGQTVGRGQAADFFLSSRGYEGFADPINLSLAQWSTQRFPNGQDPSSLPLQVSFPSTFNPGDSATIHVETGGVDAGIYYLDYQASSGSINRTFELALVVN